MKGGFHALSAKTGVEKELKANNERLAKVEAQLLKEEKKYDIINEEHKILRNAYTKLESKANENEFTLKQKLAQAKKNEKQLTMLMNQVLSETKNSISSDVHNILLSKMESLNVKSSNFVFKEAELRVKISRLESI